jgi:hypothetical protein
MGDSQVAFERIGPTGYRLVTRFGLARQVKRNSVPVPGGSNLLAGSKCEEFCAATGSKEIRGWCSVLEHEMMHWSGVKMSHIFGTQAFYHRKVMFAMPDRRSLDSSTAISFRGPLRGANEDAGWQAFELSDPNLLDTALSLLGEAYRDSVAHPFPEKPQHSR